MNTHHHLLIVDDDPEERYLMHLAFADISWEKSIQFFHSAEACLRHLALLTPHQYPALLLFDYHMPGINGGMLLDKLKQSPALQHLPVLIYSTYLTTALEESLLQKGAMQCFHKTHNYSEAIAFATLLKDMCLADVQHY